MAQFIQIGNAAVNMELVASVEFETYSRDDGEEPIVYLYPVPVRSDDAVWVASFADDDYEAFKSWWDTKSGVYVIRESL